VVRVARIVSAAMGASSKKKLAPADNRRRVMGTGRQLLEETVLDRETGRIVNATVGDISH